MRANIYKKTFRIFTTALFIIIATALRGSDYFIMDKSAYKDYASVVNYPSFKHWVAAKKYNCKSYNKFCPDKDQLHWVRYFHLPSGLAVWFWVEPQYQANAVQFFEQNFLKHPQIEPYKSEIDIRPVTFELGSCLKEANLSDIVSQTIRIQTDENGKTESWQGQLKNIGTQIDGLVGKLDKINQQGDKDAVAQNIIKEAQRLAQKIGGIKNGSLSKEEKQSIGDARANAGLPRQSQGIDEKSADGSSVDGSGDKRENVKESKGGEKNGKDEIKKNGLPFNSRFAKWFQAIIDIIIYVVEYYFQIPLREYLEQAFYIFNALFPEILETLDSFFGKLQDMVFPDNFERAMDSAADIYFKADEYLQYLHKAIGIIYSGNMQNLVNGKFDFSKLGDIPFKDFADIYKKISGKSLGKYGDMAASMLGNLNFKDIKNMDAKQLRGLVVKKGKDILIQEAEKKLSKIAKIDVDVNGFIECAKDKRNCKEWAKKQGTAVVNKFVPEKYRKYSGQIINGDYKEAAKEFVYDEIQNRTKINPYELEKALNHIRNKNYRDAVKVLGQNHLEHFGPYKELAQQILDGETNSDSLAQKAIVGLLKHQKLTEAANYIDKYGLDTYEYLKSGSIKQDIEQVLNQKFDPSVVKDFITENAEAGMNKLIDNLFEDYLGFTNAEAREELRNGDLERAIELQILAGGWQKIDYQEKADTYVKYVKNRLEMVKSLLDRRKSNDYLRKLIQRLLLENRIQFI